MKKLAILIIVVLIIFSASACETTEKIDDFPLRPAQLVVNCLFTNDSTWDFQVSRSLSTLDNADLPLVDDATIILYRDNTVIDTIAAPDGDGYYHSITEAPQTGRTYSIQAFSPTIGDTITASDYLPTLIEVEKVDVMIKDSAFYKRYYDEEEIESGWYEGSFFITFSDPPEERNYYKVCLYVEDRYFDYDDSVYKYYFEKLFFSSTDPVASAEASSNLAFSDEIINGLTYRLKIDIDNHGSIKGEKYIAEIVTMSEAAYLYENTVNIFYESVRDPFSEPVIVYDNIENGYGIFAGQQSSSFEFIPIPLNE
mgnify:CR=1 FL=1